MANMKKTYYFPPTWDVHPQGPLKLGSVLASTKRPLQPLLICPVTDIPQPTIFIAGADPAQPQIYSTTRQNISYITSTLRTGSFTLFASFIAAVLGVGPDMSTKLSNDNILTLNFARLDTQEWYPSTAELWQRVKHPSVSRFLERSLAWRTKKLFVVTGVKVAYGATAESKAIRETGGEGKVTLDPGTSGGMPGLVEFGTGAGLQKKENTEVAWESGADGKEDPGFVFAYRVQRVKIKKKDGELVEVTSKDHTSGAVYDDGAPSVDKPEEYEIDADDPEDDDSNEDGVFVEAGDGDDSMWLIPP